MNKIVKCPFCTKLYETFSMMVGDQSCCPDCRRKAKENFENPDQQQKKKALDKLVEDLAKEYEKN